MQQNSDSIAIQGLKFLGELRDVTYYLFQTWDLEGYFQVPFSSSKARTSLSTDRRDFYFSH